MKTFLAFTNGLLLGFLAGGAVYLNMVTTDKNCNERVNRMYAEHLSEQED